MCNGGGASGYVPNNILEATSVVGVSSRAEPIYSHTIQVAHLQVAMVTAYSSLIHHSSCFPVMSSTMEANDAKEGV